MSQNNYVVLRLYVEDIYVDKINKDKTNYKNKPVVSTSSITTNYTSMSSERKDVLDEL